VVYACDVSAGLVQAGNESKLNWIGTNVKDNRNCGGRSFGRNGSRRAPERNDHADLPASQIGGQPLQLIVVALRPTIFDRQIQTFGIASFLQAVPERAPTVYVLVR